MKRGKRVLRRRREQERREALRRSEEFADNIAWLMHKTGVDRIVDEDGNTIVEWGDGDDAA